VQRTDFELRVNDVFREVADLPPVAKLFLIVAIVELGAILCSYLGPQATALVLLVAYAFLAGWTYGDDTLR
jgi:hypothetical protein